MSVSSRPGRCIILSPHLDDAVLSCGGLMSMMRHGVHTEVWTVFSSGAWRGPYSPSALWLHGVTGIASPIRLYRLRRSEDRRANRSLGAGWRHLSLLDAPYRKDERGNFLYPSSLSVNPHPDDGATIDTIATILRRSLRPDDTLLSPVAIGGHVDHVIVRQAAERAVAERVCYYPDFPYVHSLGDTQGQCASLSRLTYRLSPPDLRGWLEAIATFETQVDILDDSSLRLADRLKQYGAGDLHLYAFPKSTGEVSLERLLHAADVDSGRTNEGSNSARRIHQAPRQGAPVAVFAFRRLALIKRTLASLEGAKGFDAARVVVFSDAARRDRAEEIEAVGEVRSWLSEWCNKKGAALREAKTNLGLRRSVVEGVSAMLESDDRVIVMEDDLIVSRAFLTFMNRALETFKDREDIVQISGYQVPHSSGIPALGLLRAPASWGWATWRRAWQHYRDEPDALAREIRAGDVSRFNIDGAYDYLSSLDRNAASELDTWAVRWYASVFLRGGMTLYPDRSLVRNIGFGDDGTNCEPGRMGKVFAKQPMRMSAPEVSPSAVGTTETEEYAEVLRTFYRWQQHEWTRPSFRERVEASVRRFTLPAS